jgi:hypothetical protein
VEWLSQVVPGNKKSTGRFFQILKSALNGSYRRHSPPDAFLRDLVSLIR